MDLSKIKPLHDLVLIQRDKAKAQEGLIHLPDDRIEQSYWEIGRASCRERV